MLQQSAAVGGVANRGGGGGRASSAACSRKLGWTRKDCGFNRRGATTEADGADDARIAAAAAISSAAARNEPRRTAACRATANPTRVCLKPEALHESKEQFARRIRQAWIDREQSKSCINIYLARNAVEERRPPAAAPAAAGVQPRPTGGRAALEVQLLQSGAVAADDDDDDDDDHDAAAAGPLSAAARRVRFYRAARRQRREATPTTDPRPAASCRAVSAPSAAGNARRLSAQEVPPQPHGWRKLKSCRNKAFHKSIDADARGPHRGGKYGKPIRNLQHGGEVVTMMSLLSPVGSDTEEDPARPPAAADRDDASAKTVTFPQFNHNIRYQQKSFDSAVQSIGKSRPLNNRVGKSLIKSKTLDISISRDDEVEDVAVPVTKRPDEEEHCSDNSARERAEETAEIAEQYDTDNGQPMLKSDKEKECWDLFKKMTAKGVSVTFDTVLRGMLTPTEYRLRKGELLSFG